MVFKVRVKCWQSDLQPEIDASQVCMQLFTLMKTGSNQITSSTMRAIFCIFRQRNVCDLFYLYTIYLAIQRSFELCFNYLKMTLKCRPNVPLNRQTRSKTLHIQLTHPYVEKPCLEEIELIVAKANIKNNQVRVTYLENLSNMVAQL